MVLGVVYSLRCYLTRRETIFNKAILTRERHDRLQKAAAEAMADSIGEPAVKPEPAEVSGTKDKIAEEKLSKA